MAKKVIDFKYEFNSIEKLGDEGIIYTLPQSPPDHEIENYRLPIEKQNFKRTEIPDYFNDVDRDENGGVLLDDQQQKFYLRERNRRINGHWYFIKGKKIYITGDNYFYLNYWQMDANNEDGFPDFRWGNAKYFYFLDWVDKNKKVYGGLFLTQKRFGKALDVETDIPTPEGWKKMKDLDVGDTVFANDGTPTKVSFVTEIQHDRDCYEILFSDGSKIIADADHKWIASDYYQRQWFSKRTDGKPLLTKTVTTKEMFDKQHVQTLKHNNWSIENAKPVKYEEKTLRIPPYILGLWLGDGSSYDTKLTSIDEEIINDWKAYGESIGLMCKPDGVYTHRLTSGKHMGYHNRDGSQILKTSFDKDEFA